MKLPKVVIDTMEYDFITRRISGRGYSTYFQDMDWKSLTTLALHHDRLKIIIPNHVDMFEDCQYIRHLLDIFLKEEIQRRQEMIFLTEGIVPYNFNSETVEERRRLVNFLNGIPEDEFRSSTLRWRRLTGEDLAVDIKSVPVIMNTMMWKHSEEYCVNLNNIRQSVRLREKKESRREKALEELRISELDLRRKKNKARTQRYNKKVRHRLRKASSHHERSSVQLPEQKQDRVGDIPDNELLVHHGEPVAMEDQQSSRIQRKRPKMIIVDKAERRPPSRLVGQEFVINRSNELVHETLENYDYLVQEFIIDPDDETVCMIVNTYLKDDQYMATLIPIETDDQLIFNSSVCRTRQLLGKEGVVELVNQFHLMATGNNKWPTTMEQWLNIQKQDCYWLTILDKIDVKGYCLIVKNTSDYVDYIMREDLNDGCLGPLIRRTNIPMKLTHSNRILSYIEEVRQMIVPNDYVMMCMDITHTALGHPGYHRMLQTVRKSYYWASMMTDIRTYCSNCHHCRARKSSSERGSVPILGYYMSERPWQRCHIDCMVGLPTSDIGYYTAVLILKCSLSKFICLEPLKDISAQSISEALVTIFTHHGVPEYIISDNGVEFSNYLTTDVLRLLGTYKFHITAMNPHANGQVENQVKTVKDMLSMLVSKDQRDWSLYIRLVQMKYNFTVNQSTGFSPYFMMNGREMPIPDQQHIQSIYDNNKNIEIEGYFGNLILAMMLIWEAVGEEILQKTEHYNKSLGIDVDKDIKSYEPGQYVFVKRVPRRFYKDQQENIKYHINFKLQPIRWTGPYRILERISPVLYVLDFHNTRKKVHIIHLKLASNTSISRRRLELIRLKQRRESKETINDDSTMDEIWQDHYKEENLE